MLLVSVSFHCPKRDPAPSPSLASGVVAGRHGAPARARAASSGAPPASVHPAQVAEDCVGICFVSLHCPCHCLRRGATVCHCLRPCRCPRRGRPTGPAPCCPRPLRDAPPRAASWRDRLSEPAQQDPLRAARHPRGGGGPEALGEGDGCCINLSYLAAGAARQAGSAGGGALLGRDGAGRAVLRGRRVPGAALVTHAEPLEKQATPSREPRRAGCFTRRSEAKRSEAKRSEAKRSEATPSCEPRRAAALEVSWRGGRGERLPLVSPCEVCRWCERACYGHTSSLACVSHAEPGASRGEVTPRAASLARPLFSEKLAGCGRYRVCWRDGLVPGRRCCGRCPPVFLCWFACMLTLMGRRRCCSRCHNPHGPQAVLRSMP